MVIPPQAGWLRLKSPSTRIFHALCRAPEREEMQEKLLSIMRPDNNEVLSRNFRLNCQQTETVTGTLWRWKTNIHDSDTSCLRIWITHLAVRRKQIHAETNWPVCRRSHFDLQRGQRYLYSPSSSSLQCAPPQFLSSCPSA